VSTDFQQARGALGARLHELRAEAGLQGGIHMHTGIEGLAIGSAMLWMGWRTLHGWQADNYRRPRAAGWAAIIVAAGFIILAVSSLTHIGSWPLLWACFGLMLAGAVLMACSGMATRLGRRNR
jgi:hypothetical protein